MSDPAILNPIPKIEHLEYDPTWMETLGAAFRTENVAGSAYQRLKHSSLFGLDDQTPVNDAEIEKALGENGVSEYVRHFVDVRTRGELDNKINRFKAMKEDKDTIARAGVLNSFSAVLLAGVADLPTVVPISAMGSAIKAGGVALSNVPRLAGAAAVDAAITETALHATQELRTPAESAVNIGATAVVAPGLVLGATAIGKAVLGRVFDNMTVKESIDLSERLNLDIRRIGSGEAAITYERTMVDIYEDVATYMRGETPAPRIEAPTSTPRVAGKDELPSVASLRAAAAETTDAVDPAALARLADTFEHLEGARDGDAFRLALDAHIDDLPPSGLSREQWTARQTEAVMALRKATEEARQRGIDPNEFVPPEHLARTASEAADAGLPAIAGAGRAVTQPPPGLPHGMRWEDATDGPATPPPGGTGGEPPRIGGPDAEGPRVFDESTPSQLAFANSLGVERATRGLMTLAGRNPVLELMNSSVPELRAVTMHLADMPAATVGANNLVANPIAVQNLAAADVFGIRNELARSFVDSYKKWRTSAVDFKGEEWENFSRLVAQTMSRGNYADVEPPVREAAIAARKVFDGMYERAVEAGLVRRGAWQQAEVMGESSSLRDFDAARARATDIETAGDAEIVTGFERTRRLKSDEGPMLLEDLGSYGAVMRAVRDGELDVDARDPGRRMGFTLSVGPDGSLGDDLIKQGGWLRRSYTPEARARIEVEKAEFVRLEAMATLQARDRDTLAARRVYQQHVAEQTAKGLEPEMVEPTEALIGSLRGTSLENAVAGALRSARGKFEMIVYATQGGKRQDDLPGAGARRGPLLERTVNLSDEILLARGWIDSDVLALASHALKSVSIDTRIAERFRRPMTVQEMNWAASRDPRAYWIDGKDPTTVPDLRLDVQKETIRKKYDDLIDATDDPARKTALRHERALLVGGIDKRGRNRTGALDDMNDMLRGVYNQDAQNTTSASVLNAIRQLNFTAMMAGNAITSLPEAAQAIIRHGFGNALRHFASRAKSAIDHSLGSPERLAELAARTGDDPVRIGKNLEREAKAAGIAMEQELLATVAARFELSSPLEAARRKHGFLAGMDWLTVAASRMFFIEAQTNAIRKAGYGIFTDRIIRVAMDPSKATRMDLEWTADLGATAEFLKRIRSQVVDHYGAYEDGGVWQLRTDRWQDEEIRSIFWAMGHHDVNRVHINPTALDKPEKFQSPVGRHDHAVLFTCNGRHHEAHSQRGASKRTLATSCSAGDGRRPDDGWNWYDGVCATQLRQHLVQAQHGHDGQEGRTARPVRQLEHLDHPGI